MKIGRIQRVKLREVWRHEALDFTTWLEKNIEFLNDATGLQLADVEREKSTGSFSVDLVAEDKETGLVVIENQLEKSDHGHLGKLLTYLVGIEATRAVWIVSDPRPEHVRVIDWLNENTSADFYLLKLEVIQIGDSDPAPLLTKIVGPSEESGEGPGTTKKTLVKRDRRRYRFFQGLLEHSKSKTELFANISPSTGSWVGAGSGFGGLPFNYTVLQHGTRIELYIDTRDGEENKRIFNSLFQKKEEIESVFGEPLVWETKEERRSCRIYKSYESGGWQDVDKWDAVHKELAEAMAKLESALRPHLNELTA